MLPEDVDIFFSARFLGNETERKARAVFKEVKNLKHNTVMVDARAGEDFGKMTRHYLYKTKVMVIIACNEYGAKTKNGYSSFHELQIAYENGKPLIIVQMCKNWPPTPKPSKDIGGEGVKQNYFILGRQGLCKLRWHQKPWNAADCAKEIVEAFEKLQHPVVPLTQGIQEALVNIAPPPALETEYKSNRALEKLDTNQIDICIISLELPSMLHRLSSTFTSIHDMEQDLKGLSIDASILLVDGNDEYNLNYLLENDRVLRISSLVFIGEGIEDCSWTSSKTAPIVKFVDKMKDLGSLPKLSIDFKYGANAFKNYLKQNCFTNVEVWDRSNASSFGEFVSNLRHSNSNTSSRGVVTLAWSPPTLDWRNQHSRLGNLSLMVGDAEMIDEMKGPIIEAVRSVRKRNTMCKCFKVQSSPQFSYANEEYDAISFRTRAIVYYLCQEVSIACKNSHVRFDSPMRFCYAHKKKDLLKIAADLKGHSGCVLLWIDLGGNDSSALDLQNWLEETISGQLRIVYIVSRDMKTNDDDSDLVIKPIIEHHGLTRSKHVEKIDIAPPKTDIELSQRQVTVNLTIPGFFVDDMSPTKLSSLLKIIVAHLFDSEDVSLPLKEREVCFYKGDNECGHMCICVRNIKQLNHMFFLTFIPDNRKGLERELKDIDMNMKVDFEILNPLKIFQQCVLELDTLTPYQEQVLKEIMECTRVVVDGAAGTGKTFVGMHLILKQVQALNQQSSEEVIVSFCCDDPSLMNDIVKWLRVRLGGCIENVNVQLKKIHFLCRDGDGSSKYRLQIRKNDDGELEVIQLPVSPDEIVNYKLSVIDEGHKVFSKKKLSRRLPLFNDVKEILIKFNSSEIVIGEHTSNLICILPIQFLIQSYCTPFSYSSHAKNFC